MWWKHKKVLFLCKAFATMLLIMWTPWYSFSTRTRHCWLIFASFNFTFPGLLGMRCCVSFEWVQTRAWKYWNGVQTLPIFNEHASETLRNNDGIAYWPRTKSAAWNICWRIVAFQIVRNESILSVSWGPLSTLLCPQQSSHSGATCADVSNVYTLLLWQ